MVQEHSEIFKTRKYLAPIADRRAHYHGEFFWTRMGRTQYHVCRCPLVEHRTQNLIRDLRQDSEGEKIPLVLIADIERKPIEDDDLYFVRGNVSDATLLRANLPEADTVIILGDDALDYASRDAKVILATLTIESIRPEVYTIVELVNDTYVQTCRRAKS